MTNFTRGGPRGSRRIVKADEHGVFVLGPGTHTRRYRPAGDTRFTQSQSVLVNLYVDGLQVWSYPGDLTEFWAHDPVRP
jgi:hypothetical protein